MSTHTILVAFEIEVPEGDLTRQGTERALRQVLPRPGLRLNSGGGTYLECWWVAEDERYDGSDNDSAIFIHPGVSRKAYRVLREAGLTASCNDPDSLPFYRPTFEEG